MRRWVATNDVMRSTLSCSGEPPWLRSKTRGSEPSGIANCGDDAGLRDAATGTTGSVKIPLNNCSPTSKR